MTIGRIPSVEGGIQPTIVDAKGDLIAGVAADSVNRLAVGSNDQVLVADSSTSTGLAWRSVATPFAAGKNKVINGDMRIWQRGTSFSPSTIGYFYTADRFRGYHWGGTTTISQQTFTPGTAPVAGYEGQFFLRINQNNTATYLEHPIEDVRTFAGQTVTVSFWAKAASSMTFDIGLDQNFGSGGSSLVPTTGSATVGTSWTRHTVTLAVPSISGKTIGTGSSLNLKFSSTTLNTNFDLWGVQIEAGPVATPFQTATGTLQGELAACQRYYYRQSWTTGGNVGVASGISSSTTTSLVVMAHPVFMRVAPSAVDWSVVAITNCTTYTTDATAVTIESASPGASRLQVNVTGQTTNQPVHLILKTNSFIGLSAEL